MCQMPIEAAAVFRLIDAVSIGCIRAQASQVPDDIIGRRLGEYTLDGATARAALFESMVSQECREVEIATPHGRRRLTFLPLPGGSKVLAALSGVPQDNRLTPTELRVILELCKDLSAAQVAAELDIRPSTVRTHIRNARIKLGVQTIHALCLWAQRNGLVA